VLAVPPFAHTSFPFCPFPFDFPSSLGFWRAVKEHLTPWPDVYFGKIRVPQDALTVTALGTLSLQPIDVFHPPF